MQSMSTHNVTVETLHISTEELAKFTCPCKILKSDPKKRHFVFIFKRAGGMSFMEANTMTWVHVTVCSTCMATPMCATSDTNVCHI